MLTHLFPRPLALALLLAAPLASAQSTTAPSTRPAASQPFSLSFETTRITKPLLPDGRPDYPAALNQLHSKNVTKENNALAILLDEAFGSGPLIISPTTRDETLRQLGITDTLPGSFKSFSDFLKENKIPFDDKARDLIPSTRNASWDPEKFPLVAKWLEANEASLKLVHKAAAADHHFWPLLTSSQDPPMISVFLYSFAPVREAADALTCRAMLRLHQGQPEPSPTSSLSTASDDSSPKAPP